VSLWNNIERRRVSGSAAPLQRNVTQYLATRPHFEIYTGQDRVKQDSSGQWRYTPDYTYASLRTTAPSSAASQQDAPRVVTTVVARQNTPPSPDTAPSPPAIVTPAYPIVYKGHSSGHAAFAVYKELEEADPSGLVTVCPFCQEMRCAHTPIYLNMSKTYLICRNSRCPVATRDAHGLVELERPSSPTCAVPLPEALQQNSGLLCCKSQQSSQTNRMELPSLSAQVLAKAELKSRYVYEESPSNLTRNETPPDF